MCNNLHINKSFDLFFRGIGVEENDGPISNKKKILMAGALINQTNKITMIYWSEEKKEKNLKLN